MRGSPEFFLNAKQLVVFRRAITSARGTGLDLTCGCRDGEIGDRAVLGLTGSVRDDRGVVSIASDANRVERLRYLPDLIQLDQQGIADVFGDAPRGNRYDKDVWAFLSRGSVPAERVYLCPAGNGTHRNRLAFRDYLIAHPQAAADYTALKRRLAAEFRMDGDRYTAHKREFVDAIVARALTGDA